MPVTRTQFVDLKSRFSELDLEMPSGLSILPSNIESARTKEDLIHESETPTIRTLWRQAAVKETRVEGSGPSFPTITKKDASFVGPIIFVSWLLLSENPAAVDMAINVVSAYIVDFFKGHTGKRKAKLDVVVQENTGNRFTKIHYEGDGSDLGKLKDLIKEMRK